MLGKMKPFLEKTLAEIRESGLYKEERVLAGPQGAWITLQDGRKVLNLCANNYLGLSGHPEIVAAAKRGLDVRPVLTHKLPIAEYQKGFEVMRSGNCGKVVMEWDS